jgi:hypothetical protein
LILYDDRVGIVKVVNYKNFIGVLRFSLIGNYFEILVYKILNNKNELLFERRIFRNFVRDIRLFFEDKVYLAYLEQPRVLGNKILYIKVGGF